MVNLPATLTDSTPTNRAAEPSPNNGFYQLLRQPGTITDRTLEITFLAPGVEAFVFTFG